MISQVKIRHRELATRCWAQPCLIFILIYLTCLYNTPLVDTFIPKDEFSSHRQPQVSAYDNVESLNSSNTKPSYPINDVCYVDATLTKILCQRLGSKVDLPKRESYFKTVQYLEFFNVSIEADIRLQDLHNLFPNVVQLSINHSPGSAPSIISKNAKQDLVKSSDKNSEERDVTPVTLIDYARIGGTGSLDGLQVNTKIVSPNSTKLIWESVKQLNLSWNRLQSDSITLDLLDVFPNLEALDISNNFLTNINISLERLPYLKSMDISGNPLDCTSDLYWLENHNIELLHSNQTLCDLPPHQNKAKPIWKVIRLIKKVREECKVNCTCNIAYMWEQNHVIHSKTLVNCSNRGFTDFPDPDKLPRPTDTLDLSNNQITSIKKFVEDERYTDLLVMNLYLDSNRISSINLLEGSEWFYNFQVFTIRNNSITEVPVYVLENVFQQNRRILQIDLSLNDFKCDCTTVTTLKIWLLRYSSNIKHIDDVRCADTKESIRYIKQDDWCQINDGEALIDILDILSLFLALIIVLVVGKVYYDYWKFRTTGAVPWIVRKM